MTLVDHALSQVSVTNRIKVGLRSHEEVTLLPVVDIAKHLAAHLAHDLGRVEALSEGAGLL